jgi:hypothetical protein
MLEISEFDYWYISGSGVFAPRRSGHYKVKLPPQTEEVHARPCFFSIRYHIVGMFQSDAGRRISHQQCASGTNVRIGRGRRYGHEQQGQAEICCGF